MENFFESIGSVFVVIIFIILQVRAYLRSKKNANNNQDSNDNTNNELEPLEHELGDIFSGHNAPVDNHNMPTQNHTPHNMPDFTYNKGKNPIFNPKKRDYRGL